MKNIKIKKILGIIFVLLLIISGCGDSNASDEVLSDDYDSSDYQQVEEVIDNEETKDESDDTQLAETIENHKEEENQETQSEKTDKEDTEDKTAESEVKQDSMFDGYAIIEVDGGDLSGSRKANVAVDIGYGDREYWAFTNKYGQVVKVVAKEIILQKDSEPLTSQGRYYSDEAKVPGTEREDLDEGHIIADSLGGVSNAYNITPQDSTLNRYGDQAYMEKVIRDAGGCSDFTCIITYLNTKTQIPSHYEYTYTLMGNVIVDSFPNANPEAGTSSSSDTTTNKDTSDKTTEDTTTNKNTTSQDDSTSGKCYITKTGKKYHSIPKCGTTKSSYEATIAEAKQKGLEPCSKCY